MTFEDVRAQLDLLESFTSRLGMVQTLAVSVSSNIAAVLVDDGNMQFRITPVQHRHR